METEQILCNAITRGAIWRQFRTLPSLFAGFSGTILVYCLLTFKSFSPGDSMVYNIVTFIYIYYIWYKYLWSSEDKPYWLWWFCDISSSVTIRMTFFLYSRMSWLYLWRWPEDESKWNFLIWFWHANVLNLLFLFLYDEDE